MKICANCGSTMRDDATACSVCKKTIEEMEMAKKIEERNEAQEILAKNDKLSSSTARGFIGALIGSFIGAVIVFFIFLAMAFLPLPGLGTFVVILCGMLIAFFASKVYNLIGVKPTDAKPICVAGSSAVWIALLTIPNFTSMIMMFLGVVIMVVGITKEVKNYNDYIDSLRQK